MTEDERDDLIDRLPTDMTIWDPDDELEHFGGNYEWWRETLGHPRAHPGCCRTCGCATSCMLGVFHGALIASVVRELDRIGALVPPADVTTGDPT